MVTVTVMDGHGHGNGRSKRSGTVRNDLERSENIGHGHVTFSAKNEKFTVTFVCIFNCIHKIIFINKAGLYSFISFELKSN